MTGALADPGTREALRVARSRARRVVVVGALLVALAVVAVGTALALRAGRRPGVPLAGSVALLAVLVGTACVVAGLLQVRTVDRWTAVLGAVPWWAGTLYRTATVAFAVQVHGGPLLDLRLRRGPVPAARALDRVGEGPARVVRSGPTDWLVGVERASGPELLEAWHAPPPLHP